MDKRRRIVLPVIFLLMLFFNIRTNAEVKDSSVTIILPKGLLKVQVCSDEIVHITHTPTYHMKADTSLSVTAKWKSVSYSVSSTHEETKIAAEKLTIHIDNLRGTISIYDKSGSILLQENADNPVIFTPTIIAGENTYNAQLNINFSSSEGIFGLGQFQDGVMNYRGQEVVLVQENTQVAVPFLLSSKKYGLMFDNYSKIRFSDKGKISYICFEVADQIDYYFIAGSDMDEVIRGYRAATGQAPLYGKWAYGYWQSKERYKTQDEILNIAAEFRRRKIPIDNIVQDWQYWGHDNAYWNAMRFDSLRYPNPAGMIDKLHNRYKTHLMVSIWPVIGQKAELYDKLKQKGLLYSPYHWTDGHTYDAYSPEARKLYWNEINKGLFSLGVDAFWMDATEPEVVLAPHERSIKEAYRNYIGTMARYLNPYSLLTTGAVYNGQRSVTSEKRVYILSRSAFPGQQRYAATTWSGDIVADWQVFRNQIPAGLNFCMAGLPYWTNDIGGFHIKRYGGFPEGCNDPGYRELYVRWFQFGVFNPIFRSHGTDSPREPWQFGRPGSWAYDAIISYDNLRYRMIPYIYSLAWKITNNGYTLMRGLPMDFPNDTATYRINDQFMFGQAILVNPVTEHMYYGQSYLSETIPRTRLRTPFKQQGG
ncbi:MAG: TIM-barrel domain-containing protein, partial [Bacillota bacterium]